MKPRKKAKPFHVFGPVNITEFTWLYVERTHLLVVHEARAKDGSYIQTDQVRIPWRIIDKCRKLAP